MAELWGGETRKAVDNFPVSGEPIPAAVVHWLGRIKAAAARVERRARAARPRPGRADRDGRRRGGGRRARRPVPDRRLPDRLGHLVEHERQRGDRDRWPARACIPTTTSTWASPRTTCSRPPCTWPRSTAPATSCCRRSSCWATRWRRKADEFARRGQGRPHPSDGRRAGHARPGVRRLRGAGARGPARGSRRRSNGLGKIPLGGTAVGTGLNTHPRVRRSACASGSPADTGLESCRRPIRSRRRPTATAWSRRQRRAQGRRRLADQDRQRPALDGLGPARGAWPRSSSPSCRRAARSCPARSTR